MVEGNKFRLGLFVLGGVSLFFAAIFYLGMADMFGAKAKFVTLFDESVQGIAIGSPVKYKGVPIGSVSKVTIQVDNKLIRVDMVIDLNAFSTARQIKGDYLQEFYNFFRKECDMGLRCRLEYAGITGLKFVELDYFAKKDAAPRIPRPKHFDKLSFYIPATPSIFKDILKLINKSLERISKINFEEISNELQVSVKEASSLLKDPKLKETIYKLERMSDNLEKTSSSITSVLTEKKLRQLVNKFEDNLKSLDELATRVNKQVKGAKFDKTTESFRDAADSVTNLKRSMENTLMRLDQTLDAISELVNSIDDDPASLLSGKSALPIKFPVKNKTAK